MSSKFYIGEARRLSDADFSRLAQVYGIEEAALRAVAEVEARGEGFYSSGAIICLYEPHIAYKYSSGSIRTALVKAGLAYATWKPGMYPATSYPRIDQCSAIAGEEIAALATSWGVGQVMGFNFKALGHTSAVSMVKWFADSEANQLEGMVRFIKSNPAMLAALKAKDWAGFAKRYNGEGYAKNKYDTKLAAAYAKWSKRKPAAVVPEPVVEPEPAPAPAPSPAPVPTPTPIPSVPAAPKSFWAMLLGLLARLFRRK